jgi:aspartate aminotransferase
MSTPQTLSRPLASRVGSLPDEVERSDNPPISEGVIEAAIQALKDGKTHYTDRPGILGLRKWATDYLAKHFNVTLKPDAVTITCGATEARFVVIKRLLKAGDIIIHPGDGENIKGAAQLAGVEASTQIRDADKVKLIYLQPFDEMGGVSPLLKLAEKHGWWIIYDLATRPNAGGFHPAQNSAIASKVISIGSFSDTMPGWRVGWMAGSEMADKLRAYKQSMTICSTSISQWAGMGLVEE